MDQIVFNADANDVISLLLERQGQLLREVAVQYAQLKQAAARVEALMGAGPDMSSGTPSPPVSDSSG